MTDMRLNASINVSTGAAVSGLSALERGSKELTQRLKDGNIAAIEYAATMPKLAQAAKNLSASLDASNLASARTLKTTAEANFKIRQTEILTEEATARAVERSERAKRRELAETAKTRKAAMTDSNPGAVTQLPQNYLASRAVGLPTQNMALPDAGQLNQTRYALYDVSTTLGVLGAALTAAGGSSILFATQYETALAQVARTTQLAQGSAGLEALATDLRNLSESIPVGFAELADIASLGAQLNIAAEDLESFSETVAQFATVSRLSTERVAQDFGAIGELLDVSAGDYQKLGSAINFAGITSVATDAEILSLTTNIAASANQAGFAAAETVGLASALASLRIAPEQARGVILRLFADFDRVVSENGEQLTKYANVLGTTTEQASALWNSEPEQFFDALLQGLSTAQDLNATLTELGITETRESNVLQRLAGNYNVYTQSIQNATAAYADGTFLGESFAVQADTIAARVEILVNSIQNLLASAGESLLPVLKPVLEVLTFLVQAVGDIPAPILATITTLTLLAGGLALLVAGGAAFIASAFAVQTAIVGIQKNAVGATTTGAALRQTIVQLTSALGLNSGAARLNSFTIGSLVGAQRAAAVSTATLTTTQFGGATAFGVATGAARGFTAALLSVPLVNIIAGLSILIPIVFAAAEGLNQAQEKAKQTGDAFIAAGGGMASLMQALEADAEAVRNGAESFGTLTLSARGATDALTDNEKEARAQREAVVELTTGAEAAANATGGLSSALGTQTYELAENTKAWFANAAAQSEALKAMSAEDIERIQATGFNYDKAVEDVFSGRDMTEVFNELGLDPVASNLARLNPFDDSEKLYDQVLALFAEIEAGKISMEAASAQAELLGINLGGVGDAAEASTDVVSQLGESVKTLFSAFSTEANFLDAMDALNAAIDSNGASFDNLSQVGRENLGLLETALVSATAYGAQLGISAEDSIAEALFSVNGKAVDTAALLQQLASVPAEFRADLDISAVIAKYNQIAALGIGGNGALSVASKQSDLNRLIAQRDSLAKQAATSSGGGGRSNKAAKAAASNVKTLAEYVRDLGTAMKGAFDARFGLPQAIDDVSSKFNSMAKAIQDAKDEARDLTTELEGLLATRGRLEKQLEVAVEYGDTVRADEIRAELSDNSNKTTDTRSNLVEANARANAELNGNTQAAINNRAAVLSLISAYQGQIEAFAATGASAAQVSAYTAQLQGQFQSQLIQLGFNATAINAYAAVFGDLSAAIVAVPTTKTITVNAETGAASAKISSLSAQLAALDGRIGAAQAELDKAQRAAALQTKLSALVKQMASAATGDNLNGKTAAISAQIKAIQNQLATGNYFRGGVIGGSTFRSPSNFADDTMINAKIGEGVVNLKGMDFLGADGLNAINHGQSPFAPQVIVTTPAVTAGGFENDQYIRQLLVDIRNSIGLTIQGTTLSRVVDAEQTNAARRRRR